MRRPLPYQMNKVLWNSQFEDHLLSGGKLSVTVCGWSIDNDNGKDKYWIRTYCRLVHSQPLHLSWKLWCSHWRTSTALQDEGQNLYTCKSCGHVDPGFAKMIKDVRQCGNNDWDHRNIAVVPTSWADVIGDSTKCQECTRIPEGVEWQRRRLQIRFCQSNGIRSEYSEPTCHKCPHICTIRD